MNIHVMAVDGVFDLGLAALLDTLATANELAATLADPPAAMAVSLVGVRQRVKSGHGLGVPVRAAARLPRPDAVLLPAVAEKMPAPLLDRLGRRDIGDACGLLRGWAEDGAWLGAACTGTFVLADSGLLNDRQATTSWWLASMFRQRYPRIALDESRMLVSTGSLVTAGAALAHMDLALRLVRRHSPVLATLTARYLLVEPRASQAIFVIPDHLAHSDPLVERYECWARANLARGFSLPEAAAMVGTSERTLARRIQRVLGKSPLAYFQDLRVERATHLLQTSAEGIEQIAAQVGYTDGVTLRTLLRRRLGKGVRELRGRET